VTEHKSFPGEESVGVPLEDLICASDGEKILKKLGRVREEKISSENVVHKGKKTGKEKKDNTSPRLKTAPAHWEKEDRDLRLALRGIRRKKRGKGEKKRKNPRERGERGDL